jgi:hypothetical protein
LFEEKGFLEVARVFEFSLEGEEGYMAGCAESDMVFCVSSRARRTECQDDAEHWSQSFHQRHVGTDGKDVARVRLLDADRDHRYQDSQND